MLVSQILSHKAAGPGVVTIPPGASLRAAVELLAAHRIGAVVVAADGKRVEGILSERDVVRELSRRGAACLDDTVAAAMTREVSSCTLTDTADRILETMTRRRFRHMPVIEGGEMVGLISIGDVVAARLAELQMERDALTGMIMGN